MLEWIVAIVVFLVMMSILVVAHELGHYLFARLFGMGVEEFAVGFGKPKLTTYLRRRYLVPLTAAQAAAHIERPEAGSASARTAGLANRLEGGEGPRPSDIVATPQGQALSETTDFTVRPWPLGGFVRIKGMEPRDDGSEVNIPGGFYSRAPWKRFIVLLAGPAFSVLAGVLTLAAAYLIWGLPTQSKEPVIGLLAKEGPGLKAGLEPGDRVVAIDGRPVSSFYDMVAIVRESDGKRLQFRLDREGRSLEVPVAPTLDKEPTAVLGPDMEPTGQRRRQWKIGAGPDSVKVRSAPSAALAAAARWPVAIVLNIAGLISKPEELKENVGGPVMMVSITKEVMQEGVERVVILAALISISVGIFNLLPIHPLDGGQMVMAVIEMFRRRRLSIQFQAIVAFAGMALVLLMFVSVLFLDIGKVRRTPNIRDSAPYVTKEDVERGK